MSYVEWGFHHFQTTRTVHYQESAKRRRAFKMGQELDRPAGQEAIKRKISTGSGTQKLVIKIGTTKKYANRYFY